MTIDNIVPIVIVAVVLISSVASGLRQAKRGFDKVVEKQRAEEPARMAAFKAQLASRGIAPSPSLQRLMATLDSVAAAESPPSGQQPSAVQPAYAAQPAYTPPQQQTAPRQARQKHQQQPQQPQAEVRRVPGPVARSMDVPIFPVITAPAAAVGTTRRTLADAFGDPAHARNAVILMEVLAPPVALR